MTDEAGTEAYASSAPPPPPRPLNEDGTEAQSTGILEPSVLAPSEPNISEAIPEELLLGEHSDLGSIALSAHAENIREQWKSNLDFLLSCLGYAVGLGNVWRFPTMAYQNGGGVFFIPYLTMLFIVGMPIFFLELSLGQFTSAGQTTCWEFCPAAQGLGFGMTLVALLTAVYYNIVISYCAYFLAASMSTDGLPWETCDRKWSSENCIGRVKIVSYEDCTGGMYEGVACDKKSCGNFNDSSACHIGDGICKVSPNPGEPIIVWNANKAISSGCGLTFPAMEYFWSSVLEADQGTIDDLGSFRLELLICLLLSWIVVICCLIGGIKTSGKVVYVTATLPYGILAVLLCRGLFLDGALDGISYYLTPRLEHLWKAKVWKDAAVQISFSLSTSFGGLIALSSYNKFHNNIYRDTLIVCIGNSLTSIFSGFVVFSFLGNLAHDLGLNIDQVSKGGFSLVFGIYPFSLTLMPGSVFWSVIFFAMLIMLGIDSEFVLTETVITALVDTFPDHLRRRKYMAVLFVGISLFLLGIPLTTQGGVQVLSLMDTYAGGWNVLIIGFLECIAINRYGTTRLIKDIEHMVGYKFHVVERLWWTWTWRLFTPALFFMTIAFSLHQEITKDIDRDPVFDYLIGLLLITFNTSILLPGGFFIFHFASAEGNNLLEKLRNATIPSHWWGPTIIGDRISVSRYNPDIVIDPEHPNRTRSKDARVGPHQSIAQVYANKMFPINVYTTRSGSTWI